jgi:hypothetical protein
MVPPYPSMVLWHRQRSQNGRIGFQKSTMANI